MPRLPILLLTLGLGLVMFVLFAFTLVGLVGEAMIVLAILGLLVRAGVGAAHRSRGHH